MDTGLIWQKEITPDIYTWQQALSYCENLILNNDGEWTIGTSNASGIKYDDWRLPNVNELQSLMEHTLHHPSIDTAYFPETPSSDYWSSTTLARSPDYAWYANFSYGNVSSYGKSSSRYVRAVRGGQCGLSGDRDLDTICNDVDNCPSRPNGTALGTCVKTVGGVLMGTGVTCTDYEECGENELCDMEQLDFNDNGIGDVCECYANFNYPTDLKVNASDLGIYKQEYGRIDCDTTPPPCQADGNNDGKVNAQDLGLFKNEYGRIDCPALP